MSLVRERRVCVFCGEKFSYELPAPKQAICPKCARDSCIITNLMKHTGGFRINIRNNLFYPMYWATYDRNNVFCNTMIGYQKKDNIYIGKVHSIILQETKRKLIVHPIEHRYQNKRRFQWTEHVVEWDEILCVFQALCA